jgi:hypothetical protein
MRRNTNVVKSVLSIDVLYCCYGFPLPLDTLRIPGYSLSYLRHHNCLWISECLHLELLNSTCNRGVLPNLSQQSLNFSRSMWSVPATRSFIAQSYRSLWGGHQSQGRIRGAALRSRAEKSPNYRCCVDDHSKDIDIRPSWFCKMVHTETASPCHIPFVGNVLDILTKGPHCIYHLELVVFWV